MSEFIFGVTPIIFWLVLMIVLAVFELATLGLTTIWFALGALVALICAIMGASIPLQIVVFIIASFVSLAAIRPLSVKYFNNKVTKTNIDALVGRKVIVSRDIDNLNEKGNVSLDGTTWNARNAADDGVIAKGSMVVIVSVEGNKLLVNRA